RKIAALEGIDVIEGFYNGNLLVFDVHNHLLFISERDVSILNSIYWKDYCIIKIKDNHIFLLDDGIYKYDETNNSFELYRSSITGGSVNWFGNNVMENNYMRSSKSVCITLFEGDSDRKIWERIYPNRRHWDSRGKYLYVTDLSFKYIDFIDIQTGKVINTLHFENPPISRFIYHYEDTLIVSLQIRPLEEYVLLGLDASTGQEKWSLESTHYSYIQDPISGYLYGIGGERFDIIAPNEGKYLCQGDMSNENKKFDVCPERGVLGKDGIYFLDNFPRSKIGLIELKTQKIKFVIDLNLPAGVKITSLSYHNGRLYVKDTDDTLHIFAEE
ncbi:MAG: hypothetical protein K2M86_06300, partial [Odoribacter sp.]|nr:hypothetical protein [Odoribacter sp.]